MFICNIVVIRYLSEKNIVLFALQICEHLVYVDKEAQILNFVYSMRMSLTVRCVCIRRQYRNIKMTTANFHGTLDMEQKNPR